MSDIPIDKCMIDWNPMDGKVDPFFIGNSGDILVQSHPADPCDMKLRRVKAMGPDYGWIPGELIAGMVEQIMDWTLKIKEMEKPH